MAYARTTTVDTGPAGDTIVQGVTDLDTDLTAVYANLNTHEALTETHGATGAVVGTTNTQTLTNKTLTSPTISGGTITSPTITGTGAIAGVFTGNLTGNVTGNVTGNCSGSSGSCTGNAATATDVSGGSVSATTGVFSSQVQTANPLFSATVTATVENCTGVDSVYTYYTLRSTSSPACNWTEITDRAANFSGGTFTAPVTGNYLFTGFIDLSELLAHTSWTIVHLITSNRTYTVTTIGIENLGYAGYGFSVIADMDTADTAYLEIVVYDGTNAKTVNITTSTYFQGYLLP